MSQEFDLSDIENPLGVRFSIDGQLYVAVEVEDRIITFRSNCPTCSEEFTWSAVINKIKYPNRRCEKHRQPGVRVKPRKTRNKRVVAQDQLQPETVRLVTELRKMRAAGKTMKQLAKWLRQTHKLEMTASEIWAMVRDVKPATNVINLKDRS